MLPESTLAARHTWCRQKGCCTTTGHAWAYLAIHSNKKILWFDVSVDNAHAMQAPHANQDLLEHSLDYLNTTAERLLI